MTEIFMNNTLCLKKSSVTELQTSEMKRIRGGGLIDQLATYIGKGLTYFYHMGLSEARQYRKQLK